MFIMVFKVLMVLAKKINFCLMVFKKLMVLAKKIHFKKIIYANHHYFIEIMEDF